MVRTARYGTTRPADDSRPADGLGDERRLLRGGSLQPGGLEGGLPSTDLTRGLEGARSAAAGVGFFGVSGNILTLTHGAAVTLGAIVTTADLPPPVLPPEANYCDECNWCGQVCPTSFMSRTDFTTVKLGEHGHHKYSTREHHMRCASHMMGMTGLSEDGTIESMPLEDARAFLDAMPAERRALYEIVDGSVE